jgi:hypothetical protein
VKDERVEIRHSGRLCNVLDDNTFGTFKLGYIEIVAASITATVTKDYLLDVGSEQAVEPLFQDYDWTIDGPDRIFPGEEVHCLLIGRAKKGDHSSYCLILQPARDQIGYYKRIGSSERGNFMTDYFGNAEIMTFRII